MSDLFGREAEIARIDEFLDAAQAGRNVLALEGEPGIGKSTLWNAGVERATDRGALVLSCSPTGSEVTLSFAGLGDLLDEHVGDEILSTLPEPQREAVEVALLRKAPGLSPTDHRTLAVGTRSVLRGLAAERGPLIVAIDDVQWIDEPSATALSFAVRRLDAGDPIGVFIAFRSGSDDQAGRDLLATLLEVDHSMIRLTPLDVSSLGRLITARFVTSFPVSVVRRVHEASGGNTFFAIEIARALIEYGIPDEPGAPLPAPLGLEAALRKRVAPLSEAARKVLLIIAALTRPTKTMIAAAAGDVAVEGLAAAADAGVVVLAGDRVRFVHPLFASVVYRDAISAERRRVHERLAEVLADVEERARHAAFAVDGPEPTVADDLEAAARHARARGAHASAGELFELAALRTPPSRADEIRRRTIDAVDMELIGGNNPRALALLEPLAGDVPPGRADAEVLLRYGMALLSLGRYPLAALVLTEAAAQPSLDPSIASSIHLWCGWATTYTGDLHAGERHAARAVELAEAAGDNVELAAGLGLLATVRTWMGFGVDQETYDRALALEKVIHPAFVSDLPSFHYAAALGTALGDMSGCKRLVDGLYRLAVETGDEMSVTHLEFFLGVVDWRLGRFPSAREHLDAAASRGAGIGWDTAIAARVEATLGEEGRARELAARALEGQELSVMCRIDAMGALGFLELSLGRPEKAVRALREAWQLLRGCGFEEPGLFLIPAELVEALVAIGDLRQADEVISWLQQRGETLDRALALAHAARGRALLFAVQRDLSGAVAALDDALSQHERVAMPFERARTSLVYGSVLRRAQRRAKAREILVETIAAFEGMGAVLWAERAQSELDRISGRRRGSEPLTPTETRVARLAAGGRTNREIAAEMFLSVRTVESHLSHAYLKLGIRSRTELSATLID